MWIILLNKMGQYRIGTLIRGNFQMKLSLIVGLVEAVPQRGPPCSTDALFLLGYWGYVKDTVYNMPVPDKYFEDTGSR